MTFWLYDYLGTGPYRVRSWDPSNLAVLEANRDYVLGRPKIDEIEVRFILDGNTLTASVLAGAIDIVIELGSVDRAIAVRDGWRDGQVVFQFDQGGGPWLHPQFVNPRPAVIADVQFRRALLHAIDRQNIADTLGGGVGPVAHSYLNPGQAEYREIEAKLPRYEYDPRRAAQLIEGLGYSRGADGSFRDPTGQRLVVEILSGPQDSAANVAAAVADSWQRVGIGASAVRVTPRLAQDPEAQAAFPGFYSSVQPKDVGGLPFLHSSRARLPENSFQVSGGPNWSRYMNAELDGAHRRLFPNHPGARAGLRAGWDYPARGGAAPGDGPLLQWKPRCLRQSARQRQPPVGWRHEPGLERPRVGRAELTACCGALRSVSSVRLGSEQHL